jgi:hypothetical protein
MMACPVIKVILGGERDAHKLAAFRDCRLKASEEQIARSLEGNWQEDLLFVLKQEQDGYEFCQKQMAESGRQRAQYFQQRKDRSQDATWPEEQRKGRLKKKRANNPQSEGLPRLRHHGTHGDPSHDRTCRGQVRRNRLFDWNLAGPKIRMEIIVRLPGPPEIGTSGSSVYSRPWVNTAMVGSGILSLSGGCPRGRWKRDSEQKRDYDTKTLLRSTSEE